MTDEVLKFFVLFFVVVEPVTLVPLFAAMTEGRGRGVPAQDGA
jgi:small neutral amino acid transporter SnatA (MarC family)